MGDYIYQGGQWLPWPGAPAGPASFEGDIFEAFGYEALEEFELGGSDAGFWVTVSHQRAGDTDLPHEYLVLLHTGNELRFVWVPDFVSLIRLLGELAPIAQASLSSLDYRRRAETYSEGVRGFLKQLGGSVAE